MLNVQIQITGDKETIKKLEKLGTSFNDWTPELRKVGDFLKSFYSVAVFETEGGAFLARWAALNPKYEFWKRVHWPGRGILVRSGKMKGAYTYDVSPTALELFNTADYAKYHQFGTRFMPKRILVSIDRKRKDDIIDIFKVGLANKIKSAL